MRLRVLALTRAREAAELEPRLPPLVDGVEVFIVIPVVVGPPGGSGRVTVPADDIQAEHRSGDQELEREPGVRLVGVVDVGDGEGVVLRSVDPRVAVGEAEVEHEAIRDRPGVRHEGMGRRGTAVAIRITQRAIRVPAVDELLEDLHGPQEVPHRDAAEGDRVRRRVEAEHRHRDVHLLRGAERVRLQRVRGIAVRLNQRELTHVPVRVRDVDRVRCVEPRPLRVREVDREGVAGEPVVRRVARAPVIVDAGARRVVQVETIDEQVVPIHILVEPERLQVRGLRRGIRDLVRPVHDGLRPRTRERIVQVEVVTPGGVPQDVRPHDNDDLFVPLEGPGVLREELEGVPLARVEDVVALQAVVPQVRRAARGVLAASGTLAPTSGYHM